MNSILSRQWRGLPIDDDVEVTLKKRKQNKLGQFQAIGKLSTATQTEPYDLLEALVSCSAGAQQMFLRAKRERDINTNLVYIHDPVPTHTPEYKMIRRAVSELMKKDLGLQFKKQAVRDLGLDKVDGFNSRSKVYFVNPHFLRCVFYTEAAHLWKTVLENNLAIK